jgi:iron complex transport system ATP-binding protein
MTALGFCDVRVSYNGVEAVQSFNDLLHSGEWLCLIGPNGAGKSSVLRAAAGLVPYTGSIAIDQTEIPATSARWRAQHIAYVPQSPLIPYDMNVHDYVLLGRNPYVGHFSSETKQDREVIHGVLERLDLLNFSQRTWLLLSKEEVSEGGRGPDVKV